MQTIELSFISEPMQILEHLQESKSNGTIVGISAPVLGAGIFLTAVDSIHEDGSDHIITLKGYDVTGYILERNKIKLTEIRAVCPFKSRFTNPYLKEVTGQKVY